MCGRWNLKRFRVPRGHPRRALAVGSLLLAVSLSSPGCLQTPGSTGGTVEIDVVPGEAASGRLFIGEALRATAAVEADHVYQVNVDLRADTAGTTGPAEIVAVISGDPLTQPVEFLIETSSGGGAGGSEPRSTFVSQTDGDVTIEFVYATADTPESPSALDSIRRLIRGELPSTYELLLTDLGVDDNGTSPEDAVTLGVGTENERLGTLNPGADVDFFILGVEADTTYQLNLEATDSINVTSGTQDRFGEFNFGVATAGGLLINDSASAGVPGTSQFIAAATEDVLLRLTAVGGGFDPSSPPIRYAISVVVVVPEEEGE